MWPVASVCVSKPSTWSQRRVVGWTSRNNHSKSWTEPNLLPSLTPDQSAGDTLHVKHQQIGNNYHVSTSEHVLMTLVAPIGWQLVMILPLIGVEVPSQSYKWQISDVEPEWRLCSRLIRSLNLSLKIRLFVWISDKLNYADSVINKVTTMQKQKEADT